MQPSAFERAARAQAAAFEPVSGTGPAVKRIPLDPPTEPVDKPGGAIGRGLIGMRERTGMHGGQLRTQTLDDGRFEVLATIPL